LKFEAVQQLASFIYKSTMKIMSRFYTVLLFTFLIFSPLLSQVSSFVYGYNTYDAAINGNYLYFTTFGDHKILKIDLNTPNSSPIEVITLADDSYATGLEFKGNELYYCESSNSKICKIDITNPTPVSIDVISGLDYPIGLVFRNNELYVSEYMGDKISKIDLNQLNPTAVDFLIHLNAPYGLKIYNNELYFSQTAASKISKVNLNINNPISTDLVTNLITPTGLTINGSQLYIADFGDGKVIKYELNSTSQTASDLVNTGIFSPRGLVYGANRLFVCDPGFSAIFEVNPDVLSSINLSPLKELQIFPNPASQKINISIPTASDFQENGFLLDASGRTIKTFNLTGTKTEIDITDLLAGVYFVRIGNAVEKISVE